MALTWCEGLNGCNKSRCGYELKPVGRLSLAVASLDNQEQRFVLEMSPSSPPPGSPAFSLGD